MIAVSIHLCPRSAYNLHLLLCFRHRKALLSIFALKYQQFDRNGNIYVQNEMTKQTKEALIIIL